jgi:hypothetical protein
VFTRMCVTASSSFVKWAAVQRHAHHRVSPSRTTHVQHTHRHTEARDHNVRVTHPDRRRTSR